MKKLIFVLLYLSQIVSIQAIELSADLFTCDEEKIANELKELSDLEEIVKANPTLSLAEIYNLCPHFKDNKNNSLITPYSQMSIAAPGNFPSFWFSFAFSAIGTYFIYGVVAGPITVAIVYFSTNKDRLETKKALWGCVAGTILGAGIKYVVVNM